LEPEPGPPCTTSATSPPDTSPQAGQRRLKGNCSATSRKSRYSLYRAGLASFSMTGYNPKDAEGFINLFALPITVPLEAAVR